MLIAIVTKLLGVVELLAVLVVDVAVEEAEETGAGTLITVPSLKV